MFSTVARSFPLTLQKSYALILKTFLCYGIVTVNVGTALSFPLPCLKMVSGPIQVRILWILVDFGGGVTRQERGANRSSSLELYVMRRTRAWSFTFTYFDI